MSVVLLEKFPNFEFPERTFKYISTLDIDNAFAYKYKSFIRSTGGLINDFFRLNLRVFWDRLTVLLGIRRDPYDIFDQLLSLNSDYKINSIFFFNCRLHLV